mgnify:CR=1 FL=1
MGSPINFTDVVAGNVVSASVLKANFDLINTYLASTKLPLANLQKTYALSCVSFNHIEVAASGDIHYHAFKPADDIELVEVQLYMRDTTGTAALKAQLYTTYDGATYSGAMLGDDLALSSDNTWDTDSSPSTTARLSGQPIYIKIWNTASGSSNDADDVTLNIWFKSKHRS